MELNKIAPKKEGKNESTPERFVPKHPTTCLDDAETSLNPTPNIKVNENAWQKVIDKAPEASKNVEQTQKDSKNLGKPEQSVDNVEVGTERTKKAKSESELDIVEGNKSAENVSPAKKSDVEDDIKLVEETPSEPKTKFGNADTKIIIDKENEKTSNENGIENVEVMEEEPSESIKSENAPSKVSETSTKESKGKDPPKGKSKCRKVLAIIDKVGNKCWCPILVFIVLPLVVLAIFTIKPQSSRGGVGVGSHQFSIGSGSNNDDENSGGGNQQGNFSVT